MKIDTALATALSSIIVAVVAGLAGWAAQRSSSKANLSTSRLELEREAYERARSYDTETISRQDRELDELRARVLEQDKQIRQLREQNDQEIMDLRARNRDLTTRIFLLERGVGPVIINYKEGFEDDEHPDEHSRDPADGGPGDHPDRGADASGPGLQ